MKSKFELEYTLNSSPKILFSRLSSAEGLSEWFADDVIVNGTDYIFMWDDVEHKAQLILLKDNKQVRFKWLDTEEEEEEERYFEFKLNIDELTGDVALLITDFAEDDEKEDAIYLWDTQITELKQVIGL